MSNQYLNVPFTDHDEQYFLYQNIKINGGYNTNIR